MGQVVWSVGNGKFRTQWGKKLYWNSWRISREMFTNCFDLFATSASFPWNSEVSDNKSNRNSSNNSQPQRDEPPEGFHPLNQNRHRFVFTVIAYLLRLSHRSPHEHLLL